jgi:hypothetical protein
MRTSRNHLIVALGCVGAIACSAPATGNDAGNEFFPQDSGPNQNNADVGVNNVSDAGYQIVTVAGAIGGGGSLHSVEIDNVVVVAANIYTGTSGTSETFYIQDPTGGAGLGVYKGSKDTTVQTVNVGDVVNVAGHLSSYNGSLQISTSTKYATPLAVTVVSAGTGHATSGAYPPAGSPTQISAASSDAYDHNSAAANPTQVGTVLKIAGPLAVTDRYPAGFVATDSDGGTKPQGFGVGLPDGGEIWVEDGFVYDTCIKPLDGGTLDLSAGITGVWDRYQDYYGGTTANPAPTYSVLIPFGCSDL